MIERRVAVEVRQVRGHRSGIDERQVARSARPLPNSTSASAWPPSMPGYQSISSAGTALRHDSMITALPAITHTIVRGFAAATARISASSAARECERRAVAARRRGRSSPASLPASTCRASRAAKRRAASSVPHEPRREHAAQRARRRDRRGERAQVGRRQVLALVAIGVADDHDCDVAARRERARGSSDSPASWCDLAARADRRAQALERRHDVGGPAVARAAVAEVRRRREAADQRDPLACRRAAAHRARSGAARSPCAPPRARARGARRSRAPSAARRAARRAVAAGSGSGARRRRSARSAPRPTRRSARDPRRSASGTASRGPGRRGCAFAASRMPDHEVGHHEAREAPALLAGSRSGACGSGRTTRRSRCCRRSSPRRRPRRRPA